VKKQIGDVKSDEDGALCSRTGNMRREGKKGCQRQLGGGRARISSVGRSETLIQRRG